jgi:hypothetical protein
VRVASPSTQLTIFHHPEIKTFLFGKLYCEKIIQFLSLQVSSFFLKNKACQTKIFFLMSVKKCQHEHKGRQHSQDKSHGAQAYMENTTLGYVCELRPHYTVCT